jgi:hypothetical protein
MDFEGIYCFDTAMVRFAVYPDGPDGARILAQISRDVLRDAFGAEEIGEQALLACKRHFDVIGAAAIARYRADSHRTIVLACADVYGASGGRFRQRGEGVAPSAEAARRQLHHERAGDAPLSG